MKSHSKKNESLLMGFAGKPHGIKGEMAVKWLAEIAPAPGMEVFLETATGKRQMEIIDSVRFHNDRYLIFFKNIRDRNQAEQIAGSKIYIERNQLPEPEEGEFFLQDLLGSTVFLADGSLLGKLDHLEFPAGKEVWAIKLINGKELLFPVREEFIEEIDVEAKKIVINPPSGLVDIYRA